MTLFYVKWPLQNESMGVAFIWMISAAEKRLDRLLRAALFVVSFVMSTTFNSSCVFIVNYLHKQCVPPRLDPFSTSNECVGNYRGFSAFIEIPTPKLSLDCVHDVILGVCMSPDHGLFMIMLLYIGVSERSHISDLFGWYQNIIHNL